MTKPDLSPPQYGQMQQLADDLFWLRFELPFRLNHINLFVLDRGDGWVIIDTGLNNAATAAHWQALLDGPLKQQPVQQIIVTHHHVDHVGYAGLLAAKLRVPVAMGEAELRQTNTLLSMAGDAFGLHLEAAYRRYGLEDEILQIARQDHDRFSRYVAPLPEVDLLHSGEMINSRNGTWQIRIDQGHSNAQLGLVDAQRGLYIAGDFLLPRISPNVSTDLINPQDDRLGAYLGYLQEMLTLPDDMLILPGHDWPFRGGAKRAAELIAHHQMRLDLLCQNAGSGLTVARAMAVLFDRVFNAHEVFFAAGEAHAHLAHLAATGVMRQNLKDGVMVFSLR